MGFFISWWRKPLACIYSGVRVMGFISLYKHTWRFYKIYRLLKLRPLKVLNVAHTQFTDGNVCTVLNVASILSELWINDCSFMF